MDGCAWQSDIAELRELSLKLGETYMAMDLGALISQVQIVCRMAAAGPTLSVILELYGCMLHGWVLRG